MIAVNFTYTELDQVLNFSLDVEPDLAKIVVFARGNLSVEEKKEYVGRVENIILQIQNRNNEFKSIYSLSGNVSEQSEASEDFIGSISLEYNDWDKRSPSKVILDEILDATKSIKGIKVETREQEGGPGEGKPINIKLTSDNKNLLLIEEGKIKKIYG